MRTGSDLSGLEVSRTGRVGRTWPAVVVSLLLGAAAHAQPANDDFGSAILAQPSPYAVGPFDASLATTEASEPLSPSCAGAPMGKTVWYWGQSSGGLRTIRLTTEGSNFDTIIAVWVGTNFGDLVEVACDDDGGTGTLSSVTFPKAGPDDYYVQVGVKANGTAGQLRFTHEQSFCGNSTIEVDEECDDPTSGSCCTTECEFYAEGVGCDDSNDCTTDLCNAVGVCVGTALDCDDLNVCTNDSCEQGLGCRNLPNSGPCEDGDACTVGDLCDDNDGSCIPGAPSGVDGDADGRCDLGDNCPYVANPGQANNDSLPAGDACQCGDVDDDGVVDADDLALVRQVIVGSSGASAAVMTRCNVTGPSDGGATDCDLADAFEIDRHVAGYPNDIGDLCDAYQP